MIAIKKVGDPHCGACGQHFDSVSDMLNHIDGCAAAKAMITPATMLMFGAEDPSHAYAHTLNCIPKAREAIVAYAKAIANETGSWERSQIHKRMCERLCVDYASFRPFESEAIAEVPTEQEAVDIIYTALGSLLVKGLVPNDHG